MTNDLVRRTLRGTTATVPALDPRSVSMSEHAVSERTWERYGAGTGVAFGILLLVAIFVAPQPPHIDASASKIASYYANHRHGVLTAGVFGAFSTVAAVLFIAHLRHVY